MRWTVRLGLLIGIAAASSAWAGVATSAVPARYAQLFARGTVWTYQWTARDHNDKRDRQRGRTTCRVSRVQRFGDVVASQIVCAPKRTAALKFAFSAVAGTYVGSAKGVWTASEFPKNRRAALAVLRAGKPLLPARPIAGTKRVEGGGGDDGGMSETHFAITRKGKRLCFSEGGYGASKELCFTGGQISWASTSVSAGKHKTVEMTLIGTRRR